MTELLLIAVVEKGDVFVCRDGCLRVNSVWRIPDARWRWLSKELLLGAGVGKWETGRWQGCLWMYDEELKLPCSKLSLCVSLLLLQLNQLYHCAEVYSTVQRSLDMRVFVYSPTVYYSCFSCVGWGISCCICHPADRFSYGD